MHKGVLQSTIVYIQKRARVYIVIVIKLLIETEEYVAELNVNPSLF